MKRRLVGALLCLLLLWPMSGVMEEEEDLLVEEIIENVMLDDDDVEEVIDYPDENGPEVEEIGTPREDFIDRIIALGQKLYEDADGRRKRAHYASDIYVCKNFTVYLFRQNRDDFRMEEFPDTPLVIPNNLPAAKCKPYAYGFLWEEVPAAEGNPFEVAAQFIYDPNLTKAENLELAKEFMRQARRGDYFQMSADYDYGVGAHSAIMLSYDPAADEIHWMDSNMRGGKIDGIRYGLVQFDAVKSVEWWASAFCHKKRGATLYRLREDIIYAGDLP
ncbi:MAG: hypothetical protein II888_07170 [Clostridia bacterium]|nr:hypothetical protein [Clostridia bacterium]